MADKTREEKLDQMLSDFERDWGAGAANLRPMLDANPTVRARMLEAIDADQLTSFKGVDPADRATGSLGGYYPGDGSLALPMDLLNDAPRHRDAAGTVLMTVAHEVEHAVHREDIRNTNKTFADGIQAIAEGPGPHDYTALLQQRNAADRVREANDEIAGINAIATQVRTANPQAGLRELYEAAPDDMSQYITRSGAAPNETYTPRDGLAFGADLHVEPNANNLEAMGKRFYDANHYPENYGSRALYQIEQAETAAAAKRNPGDPTPEVQVDVKALGLDQANANGNLYFPTGFHDTSAPRMAPRAPGDLATPDAGPQRLQAAWSHPLYQQAMDGLERLPEGQGLADRASREHAAGALAAQAQSDGLQRIDAVVTSSDGQRLFATQGQPGAPDALRSHVDREQAVRQPLEQSAQTLQAPAPQVQAREQDVQQHAPLMR